MMHNSAAKDGPAVSEEVSPIFFYDVRLTKVSERVFGIQLTVSFDAYYISTRFAMIPIGIKMMILEGRPVGGYVPTEGLWPEKKLKTDVAVRCQIQLEHSGEQTRVRTLSLGSAAGTNTMGEVSAAMQTGDLKSAKVSSTRELETTTWLVTSSGSRSFVVWKFMKDETERYLSARMNDQRIALLVQTDESCSVEIKPKFDLRDVIIVKQGFENIGGSPTKIGVIEAFLRRAVFNKIKSGLRPTTVRVSFAP